MATPTPTNEAHHPKPLPKYNRVITTLSHSGASEIYSQTTPAFKPFDPEGTILTSLIYSNIFNPSLANNQDIQFNKSNEEAGTGIVLPNGTQMKYIDFAPGSKADIHQTKSLDFVVMVEGEVVPIMGDGERVLLKRGDVVVQRATVHAWENESEDRWARMFAVVQDVKDVSEGEVEVVFGKEGRKRDPEN